MAFVSGPALAQSNHWSLQVGALPQGWQITGEGEDASDWQVINDYGTPVLAMTSQSDSGLFGLFGSGFNAITNQNIRFLDGSISVRFKAVSGNSDQGGGIMWRVQDDENYYIARFNPLEDNFRFYTVKNGHRRKLASASIALTAGWHEMTITQTGGHFQGTLDGQPLLNHNDGTFTKAGGVGLWTKADAVTYFADFRVVPR
ncbi:hypothetical protein [Profundibacter sp.]|uniref:hypothetical protein n=1 Tax=Profundibacter sp. TaxID=3101071 RepID=UPI003D0F59DB